MKSTLKLLGLALCLIMLQSAFASGSSLSMGSSVEYDNIPGGTANAFILTMASLSRLTIGTGTEAKQTNSIAFTSETDSAGIYYKRMSGTRAFELYSEDEARLTINGAAYVLKHIESSDELVSGSDIETGAYVLYTQQGDLMATGSDPFILFSLAVFPDDGSEVLIKEGSTFSSLDFPAPISFNSRTTGGVTALSEEEREDVETETAGRAGVEGTAPETEVGCHDLDADETPIETPSYVSVVRTGDMSIVVSDYCVEGDESIVYEASCIDGEVRITQEECPVDKPCNRGACRGEGTITKFCIDSDRKLTGESEAQGMTKSAQTKSTTVGYYAASEGGKEFGVWNDYCKDDKTLIEYYCSNSNAIGLFREIVCPEGCNEGICRISPYCYDTDGGSFENVTGSVKSVTADGVYAPHEDTCNDGTTVLEYSCDSFNEVDGFKTENKACGEGKVCRNGKCTMPTLVTECNRCDGLNPFNIWIGDSCNEDGTAAEETLRRCPAGTYCKDSENECVAEPVATLDDVRLALNKRKTWATLMDDASWWLERVIGVIMLKDISESCIAPEECASGICAIAPGFSIAVETMDGGIEPIEIPRECAEECKRNEDCVVGKTCSTSGTTRGECVSEIPSATLRIGEDCTVASQCLSNICSSGTASDGSSIRMCSACTPAHCASLGKTCSTSGTTRGECVSEIAAYDASSYLLDIRDLSSTFRIVRTG